MKTSIETPEFIKTIQDGEEVEDFSEESDEEIEVDRFMNLYRNHVVIQRKVYLKLHHVVSFCNKNMLN